MTPLSRADPALSPAPRLPPELTTLSSPFPQVEQLRGELVRVQADEERARIETGQADLLAFVRTLPDEQMLSLTSQVSDEVLDAMKRLVAAVMSGMGASEVSPSTLMQQSGSAMKDLVMWQLVVG